MGKEKNKVKKFDLFWYSALWTILLFIAVPFAYLYTKEEIFYNYYLLLISPSKLITDYFSLGGLPASFLNAGVCGLFCVLMMKIFKVKVSSLTLAGYFLVVAHCFYGLNILNMTPLFMGVILYCVCLKRKVKDNLHIAMFATSLGPFISDFLFRYTIPRGSFVFGQVQITVLGVVIAIVVSILSGFIIPALIPETAKMHKGYNLFKAGLAIGLLGIFIYAFFYSSLGIPTPDVITSTNEIYNKNGNSYLLFVNVFFIVVFLITFLIGFFINGKSLKGYSKLLKCDGYKDDFAQKFGEGLTFINIAIYGLAILLFLDLVSIFAFGVGFTGPTTGIIIAGITFSACGQTVKNVWPVVLGYSLLIVITSFVCYLFNLEIVWLIASQSYVNGLAFATGLCPFAGKYNWKVGIIAGMLCAILSTITNSMHGGFVLYNGGLTAGITALLLVPILDFYKIQPRLEEDKIID